MNRPIIKDRNELETLCMPLVEYLKKNCDPYCEIHISFDQIKVTSIECHVPINNDGD